MPATRNQRRAVVVRMLLPWRRWRPDRTVRRTVQGVTLRLPRAHLLPDFARIHPQYGQNLVRLAVGLQAARGPGAGPLQVLDIGANVGDSALQIAAATEARVLCVEADPYWAGYLRQNVGAHPNLVVEEILLTAGESEAAAEVVSVRTAGTSRFVDVADAEAGGGDRAVRSMAAGALRAAHPDFDDVRLVKSDTDGYDVQLVVAAATAWADRAPVLFFEFDPHLTRKAGHDRPDQVWDDLKALGYAHVAAWDNLGDPLGRMGIDEAAANAATLEPKPVELGYDFWDVAVCRDDDAAAIAVLDGLVSEPFDRRGAWRHR